MKAWQIASLGLLGIGTVYAVITMAAGGGDIGKRRTGKFASVEKTPTQVIDIKKTEITPVYAPVYSPSYYLEGEEEEGRKEPETKKEATSGGGGYCAATPTAAKPTSYKDVLASIWKPINWIAPKTCSAFTSSFSWG